jgi:tetratricopeptide (TPR) repeat protein
MSPRLPSVRPAVRPPPSPARPRAARGPAPGLAAAALAAAPFLLACLGAAPLSGQQTTPADTTASPAACPWPATPGVPWADTAAASSHLSAAGISLSAPDALLAAGDSAYARGRHTIAYTAYAEAARDSATFEALWKAGRAAVDVGQGIDDEDVAHRWYERGESWARRAIQLHGDRPEGHFVLSEALGLIALDVGVRQRVRMATEIRKEALATIAADSDYAGGWHVLGRWNEGIMDLSGAARFFAKAFLGAQVFGEASWQKAERDLARAARLEPGRIVHRLELGRVYMKTDRPEKARAELQATLALPPQDEQDCDYLGEARALLEQLRG